MWNDCFAEWPKDEHERVLAKGNVVNYLTQFSEDFVRHELGRVADVSARVAPVHRVFHYYSHQNPREWHLAWQGPGIVDQVKREIEESRK